MTNADIRTALIENFKGQVTRSINAQFAELLAKFGPTFGGVYNSRSYSVWSETIRPCTDRIGNRTSAEHTLNADKVAFMANKLAEAFADEVLAKVNAKTGELTEGVAQYVSGANFLITGKKGEHTVSIEQNQIINVSVKGKLFNQFPARIYVDGKFISAAKFAKI
jgi:X-X-X-Leu-X-X-Gly heptad repeat protein